MPRRTGSCPRSLCRRCAEMIASFRRISRRATASRQRRRPRWRRRFVVSQTRKLHLIATNHSFPSEPTIKFETQGFEYLYVQLNLENTILFSPANYFFVFVLTLLYGLGMRAQQLMNEMHRAEAAEKARLNPVFPKEGWWTQPAVRSCVISFAFHCWSWVELCTV